MVRSSFSGIIKEIPDIGVDNFEVLSHNRKAYFLSHFHADHIVGLDSIRFLDHLAQTNARIYMSEITSTIADYEYGSHKKKCVLMKYITPLKIGSTTINLPGNENDADEYLQVKLIPAGHSLGSVMFLFKYKNQSILYTGDFRIKPDNLPYYGQFHENNEPIKIDVMYLDTTFQDIDRINFPSRTESVQKVIELAKNWLQTDGNRVAIYARTKYAYEFVFNKIYKQLGIKVHVDECKWNLYRKLPDQIVGVTNNSQENRIHLCPKLPKNHDDCVPNSSPANYLYIYMSAYKWTRDDEEEPYIEETKENEHSVCFATHCSRSELIYFVNYFSPKSIVGFRESYISNFEILKLEDEAVVILPPTPKKVNRDVKLGKKVDKEQLMKSFDW